MPELTIIVRFPVRPERRAAFDAAFAKLLDGLRQEKSFVEARVHQDLDEPNDVVFVETYSEVKSSFIERVPEKPFFKEFISDLPSLLRRERDVFWLERVRIVEPMLVRPP